MKWMTLVLAGALTACGAADPAPKKAVVSSVASPNASFASFRTFSFGLADPPRAGYEVTSRSLEVQRRLRVVVQNALQERGFTEAADKSDFVVKLAAGSGMASNPSPERTMAPALGFIGINIYDSPSGTEVWQGSAFAEIDPAKIDDTLLQRGVDHMLDGFRAGPAAGVAQAP